MSGKPNPPAPVRGNPKAAASSQPVVNPAGFVGAAVTIGLPKLTADIGPGGASLQLPLTQRLTLTLGEQVIAYARWHAPASNDGVFQILEIFVDPLHQRQGHGSRLLRQTYDAATAVLKSMGIRPRRVWVSLEQKRQVIARAFFSKHGFQHVATMAKLYVDQDAMVYTRSFD